MIAKSVSLWYILTSRVFHVYTEFDSKKDRHEKIGKGTIGLEAFQYIMNSSRFDHIPMVLETPIDLTDETDDSYAHEIAMLYQMAEFKREDH